MLRRKWYEKVSNTIVTLACCLYSQVCWVVIDGMNDHTRPQQVLVVACSGFEEGYTATKLLSHASSLLQSLKTRMTSQHINELLGG